MEEKLEPCGNYLTVIFRNDAPLIFAEDHPTYRSVKIPLTPEQKEKLLRKHIGKNAGNDLYEDISKCFIED